MVDWSYYNKKEFEEIDKKYLPNTGEGETMATQIVTAVNKLIFKWYNDGDVYDNVNSPMTGWCNDLSSYANWLAQYAGALDILTKVGDCYNDGEYENILKELADTLLDIDYLGTIDKKPKSGSIYECDGPFEFKEYDADDEDDENWY